MTVQDILKTQSRLTVNIPYYNEEEMVGEQIDCIDSIIKYVRQFEDNLRLLAKEYEDRPGSADICQTISDYIHDMLADTFDPIRMDLETEMQEARLRDNEGVYA